MVAKGRFVEFGTVHSFMYGTAFADVDAAQRAALICVFELDTRAVRQIQKAKTSSALPAATKFLFLAPPSAAELGRRLRRRATESEEEIQQRVSKSGAEVVFGKESGVFDKVLTSGQFETTMTELTALLSVWYPSLPPVDLSRPVRLPIATSRPVAASSALGHSSVAVGSGLASAAQKAEGKPSVASDIAHSRSQNTDLIFGEAEFGAAKDFIEVTAGPADECCSGKLSGTAETLVIPKSSDAAATVREVDMSQIQATEDEYDGHHVMVPMPASWCDAVHCTC